jgi:hypothetical protein
MKEPLSPRPTIQITTEKFIIFLDYEIVTETNSIDHALCVIISLYGIFELQFGAHNRIIHLLFGILLQQPSALTKPLRSTINEWNFKIDKKERKQNISYATTMSTNNQTTTSSGENLAHVNDSQDEVLSDEEQQEGLDERVERLYPLDEEQNEMSIFELISDVQNPTTTTEYRSNKNSVKNYSTEASRSFSSSSPVDPSLVIHMTSPEELRIVTSPSPLSNENSLSSVTIQPQTLQRKSQLPLTKPKKDISSVRKRRSSPEETILSRSKRIKTKKIN